MVTDRPGLLVLANFSKVAGSHTYNCVKIVKLDGFFQHFSSTSYGGAIFNSFSTLAPLHHTHHSVENRTHQNTMITVV